MKYCTKCGQQIHDEAVICVGCGSYVEDYSEENFCKDTKTSKKPSRDLVNTLSTRYNTYGIIWLVIGIIQIISVSCILVGLWNVYAAYTNIRYGKAIRKNPTNIVASHTPILGSVVVLVLNLLFGGVIGVAGSIYYFIAIRGFVMENKEQFDKIDVANRQ